MKGGPCPETLVIDRVTRGSAAHERAAAHAADCEACRLRLAEVDALGARLAALDDGSIDPFTLKRLRARVLDAASAEGAPPFDASTRGGRQRAESSRPFWILAAAVTTAAAAFAIWFFVSARPRAASVEASRGATWIRSTDGGVDKVRITDGVFDFQVVDHSSGQHLVVVVPEGEIEDIGTHFSVTVASGRTEAIAVTEGAVVFHRSEGGDVRLVAGMSWHPTIAKAPSLAAPAIVSPDVSAAPVAKPKDEPPPAKPSVSAARPAPAPSDSAWRAEAAKDAEEDATYMRVVELLREGKNGDARDLANDYLARFPDGLRKKEMERVSAGP